MAKIFQGLGPKDGNLVKETGCTRTDSSRSAPGGTVGLHNFNLRIFNLRVSNPNKLIVDVFVGTMLDFNVPGSRPNKTL